MNTNPPAPGWYPDPSGGAGQRYWDGQKWADAPAKPKSNKGKWIAGGVAALFLVILIANTGNNEEKKATAEQATTSAGSLSTPAKPYTPSAGPAVASAGSAVRDGKFEFRVLGTERSATKEGLFNPEQAKGEFFTVTLQVTNIGDQPRNFSASSQKLIINGNKYEATSSISDKSWMENINPGLGMQGDVTFDIPPGAVPTAIECHDSMFSGGARLGLAVTQ
jgi:hypothetical protein